MEIAGCELRGERIAKLFYEQIVLKMHLKNVLKRILILLSIYSICCDGIFAEVQLGDPYRILGIERKASPQEIRQAYKKLAKKWCVYKFQTKKKKKLIYEVENRCELDSIHMPDKEPYCIH